MIDYLFEIIFFTDRGTVRVWPHKFKESDSTDFHGLRGTRSKIVVPAHILLDKSELSERLELRLELGLERRRRLKPRAELAAQ